MLGKCLDAVREKNPLVWNITNYVTVNDVANALLAVGASPIMSDEQEEAAEMAALASGVNVNIGTLNRASIECMMTAAEKASALGRVTLLDPVGAGATSLRTRTARALMERARFTVIRGNISEIKTLALGSGSTKGVDADVSDSVSDGNLASAVSFAKEFARSHGCIVAITGAIDLVSDGDRCFVIRNGRAEMSRVTGTGCQLSGITAAFASAADGNVLESCAAAVCAMGLAGEIAADAMRPGDGNATYRTRIIDALCNMTGSTLDKGAKYEIL